MALGSRSPAHPGLNGGFAAAGWLLAEVALVLMVIFQGAQATGRATPADTDISDRGDDGKGEGDSGEDDSDDDVKCPAPGVRRTYDRLEGVVLDGSGDRSAARELIRKIDATKKHRPGIMLIFGVSYDAGSPDSGTVVANDLTALIKATSFYERWKPAMRPFFQKYSSSYQTGEVIVDVYYYRPRRC